MLLIDDREGSAEFEAPLAKMGFPVGLTRLEGGDFAWEGKGEGGAPVMVGVEFKKIGELVQSLRTGRLQGHQLLKMQEMYDYRYLVIEGELRVNSIGQLLRRVGRREFRPMLGGMAANELLKRVLVLHLRGGLVPIWSDNRASTLHHVAALYRVWRDCALDEHGSHIAIYRPPTIVPISEFRTAITAVDGVGLKTSLAIERHFEGSMRRAALAGRKEWMTIEGVGEKLADHIVTFMEGKKR